MKNCQRSLFLEQVTYSTHLNVIDSPCIMAIGNCVSESDPTLAQYMHQLTVASSYNMVNK